MSENVLFCPECRAEYEEGFSVCSDCGVSLVRRLDSESGDRLVPLAREQSFEFVGNLLDRLEKEDIPYVVEAGTALKLLDGEGSEVTKPEPWEARVWVAESAKDRADRAFEEVDAEWRAERHSQDRHRYLDGTGRGEDGAP